MVDGFFERWITGVYDTVDGQTGFLTGIQIRVDQASVFFTKGNARFDSIKSEIFDWEKIRKELAGMKYEGWATAEVKGGDRARLADIASQMNEVLQI